MLQIRSLRNQLLAGFFTIIFLIALVSVGTYYLYTKIEHMHFVSNHCSQMQSIFLILNKTDNDFFDYEVTNEEYFKTRSSDYLQQHDSLVTLQHRKYHQLHTRFQKEDFEIGRIQVIDSLFNRYLSLFKRLESLTYRRGYRDFGMEGIMRQEAHILEDIYPPALQYRVLSLRRNEKDFLLRHDTSYVHHFNSLVRQELNFFKKDSLGNAKVIFHLKRYQDEFNRRYKIEEEIGLNSSNGIRHQLNQISRLLSNHFQGLNDLVYEHLKQVAQSAIIVFLLFVSITIILSLWLSLWLSRKLSHPIVRLSEWVDLAAGSVSGHPKRKGDEIALLRRSFINLIRQTRKQMNEIRDKSVVIDRKNQELTKLNQELDHFLYSTAHDLRAPLSSLSGLINLMKRELRPGELNIYLEMMQTSIKRQEDFISQIVSYAINNKLEIQVQELDIKQMILEIFQNHEFIEGSQEIQKYISLYQDVPFYSDRNRLMIILNNLVSNAIRYSDPAKGDSRMIEVKIEIGISQIILRFYDNGIGIAEEYLDKIFNMFYKANHQSKGSGLGLFILKEAVTRLEGSISVESQVKVGTLFEIRLPNHYKKPIESQFQKMNMEWYQPALN